MTQLWVTVSFDDSEIEALQRALRHYSDVCRREIRKGVNVGAGHRLAIKHFRASLKKQLKDRPSLMLFDSELYAMQAALKSYLDACEREIANGATTPFIADRVTAKKICATLKGKIERAIMNANVR